MSDALDDRSDEDLLLIHSQYDDEHKRFVVTLSCGEDYSVSLTPDRATAYGMHVLRAAQYAEYDSAVFRQMMDVTKQKDVAAQVVLDLRNERPEIAAMEGLLFSPGVNPEGEPFITVTLNDDERGQIQVDAAREHAMHVMEAPFAADLDATYVRTLTGLIGIEITPALGIVGDLGRHRAT